MRALCILYFVSAHIYILYLLYLTDIAQQGFRENRTYAFPVIASWRRAYIRVKFNNGENCYADYHEYYYYYCTRQPLIEDSPNRKYVIIRWIYYYNGRDTDDDPSQIIASAGRPLSTRKP